MYLVQWEEQNVLDSEMKIMHFIQRNRQHAFDSEGEQSCI